MRIVVDIDGQRRRMREIGEEHGLKGDALDNFGCALSDVDLELEVDVATGESEIVKINGRALAPDGGAW